MGLRWVELELELEPELGLEGVSVTEEGTKLLSLEVWIREPALDIDLDTHSELDPYFK